MSTRGRDAIVFGALLGYVAIVHSIDTLAALGVHKWVDWTQFRWEGRSGFDYSKFLAWFVVPFLYLLVLGRLDWGYFGFKRLRRVDALILGGLALLSMGAVLLILVVPGLQDWYSGVGNAPAEVRWRFAAYQVTWTVSWLVGWEFLHRYALLTQASRLWPRFGWVVVPIVEGVYHLQKHPLEMLGMVAFSVVLTLWARARKNVMPAALAHLIVELELVAFMVMT